MLDYRYFFINILQHKRKTIGKFKSLKNYQKKKRRSDVAIKLIIFIILKFKIPKNDFLKYKIYCTILYKCENVSIVHEKILSWVEFTFDDVLFFLFKTIFFFFFNLTFTQVLTQKQHLFIICMIFCEKLFCLWFIKAIYTSFKSIHKF